MIGPHASSIARSAQRERAALAGWGTFQTHFGNPQSFELPQDIGRGGGGDVSWFWHAAFVASANPAASIRERCARYLRGVLQQGSRWGIAGVVIHTGAVSGKPIDGVLDGMEDFLDPLVPVAEANGVPLLVEFGASTCGFNLQPEAFVNRWRGNPWVDCCVDLAHVYAAGCLWRNVPTPRVCHANFPGSAFGSSRDIHGWRYTPEANIGDDRRDVDRLVEGYDEIVRRLYGEGVPLIVEGSKFTGGNTTTDIEMLRRIVGC